MSWGDFLELSKGLGADPRFALSNQDVENGFVKFRNEKRLTLLTDLLNWHNHQEMPYSTVLKVATTAQNMKALGFDMAAWRNTLQDVRFKGNNNGLDWYVAKCPSCADKPWGPDDKSYRLNFCPESGKIKCHKGCSFWDVVGHDKNPTKEGKE